MGEGEGEGPGAGEGQRLSRAEKGGERSKGQVRGSVWPLHSHLQRAVRLGTRLAPPQLPHSRISPAPEGPASRQSAPASGGHRKHSRVREPSEQQWPGRGDQQEMGEGSPGFWLRPRPHPQPLPSLRSAACRPLLAQVPPTGRRSPAQTPALTAPVPPLIDPESPTPTHLRDARATCRDSPRSPHLRGALQLHLELCQPQCGFGQGLTKSLVFTAQLCVELGAPEGRTRGQALTACRTFAGRDQLRTGEVK